MNVSEVIINRTSYRGEYKKENIPRSDLIKIMADILHVPDDYELVCFLPVGIAAQPLKYADKKPFTERAWFNGFKCGKL